MEFRRNNLPNGKKRTAVPVLPPRIPTPMPVTNNNNTSKSITKDSKQMVATNDSSRLAAKMSYKVLDNDVKSNWINPRLISKIDLEMVKSSDYKPPAERNMNGPAAGHYNHNLSHQKQASRGGGSVAAAATVSSVAGGREWEKEAHHTQQQPPNGRTKSRSSTPVVVCSAPAPTLTQTTTTTRCVKARQPVHHEVNVRHQQCKTPASSMEHARDRSYIPTRSLSRNTKQQQQLQQQVQGANKVLVNNKIAYHQSAAGCFIGGFNGHESGVFGVYSETKYTFAVNGLPGNQAQASAAAAFFARAAQKLNLSSSPHRRKRTNSEDGESSAGFCGALQRSPPPVPPALLRRIGVKEITGVGKVKVMLRVSTPSNMPSSETGGSNSFFSLDKRKKQVTLVDPTVCGGSSAPEDRRVGVAAPKMFAFDAIFSQDDSQTEICSSALTDVIHAVINGTDGCLFCFGHAGLGKSYTMLGTPENGNTLGIIPCAISWLFRGINEQKQKTGARFSVRVSAVEVSGPTNQLRDLLAGHSNDSEQSPGVYLRDDPLFGNQPPHCELRVPTAEKAAHYLDAAVECRAPTREDSRDSHLLFTLHVYQYSVAGKGGVAGGRSRLHLIDLGNSERGKASGGIPLSGLGNILLAIFNGQKHLPYKEHKLTHLLKDCLSSLTCHAAMIAHVSPYAQNYSDTLTTVQLASRIHRMRRRRIKFVAAGTGNGSGGSSGEEATRTTGTGTSSEPDPSSSDLSADTVIYVGPADEATDGEHPPVYIPSLNSGDNRCSMSKALRGSSAEQRPGVNKVEKRCGNSAKTSPAHTNNTPKASPARVASKPTPTKSSDEQWIDGPRISKSKVAEARHFMKEPCHVKKRETWIDGPMQAEPATAAGYGYMDSHKKNMIRKWVEHQTSQIQKTKKDKPLKELTQFKTYEDEIVKPIENAKKQEVEESVIRTGLKLSAKGSNNIPECATPEDRDVEEEEEEEPEPELPPALPLIKPLSSREVSLESLDQLLKERQIYNAEYNNLQGNYEEQIENVTDEDDDDEVLEIIEVEEPLEPVPMQDCCLQVTEEDIAFCMGFAENPLPEVDQENPLDHPLRILSQENLTVVSTFTDSMSVYTDLERILPRHKYDHKYGFYNDDYEDPDNPRLDETSQKKFDQLARLHELYTNRLAKATVGNSETYQAQKNSKVLSRCESLSLTDMLYGVNDNSSIYSEPAYIPDQEKFCQNCQVSISRPATSQNWYADPHLSASSTELSKLAKEQTRPLGGRFQRYCHKSTKDTNLAYLRHPDGASNPNLRDIETHEREVITKEPNFTLPFQPTEKLNRRMLSIESGLTQMKLTQKQEGYDSGHDSTPRTSKHSPAAISRKAESGYDSVIRDSESSSIDSDTSRLSHVGRRGKCKHKHEKSFCSWFLNPFTCKYIEEPPETHF